MNKPFLKILADHITKNHPDAGNRLCVVLPNRRGGLFLRQYLIPDNNVPTWAPAVYSIEDYISAITNLHLPDPLEQMSALYKAHCTVRGSKALPFDDFIGWSKGLIRDFEETDQYLIQPDLLFGHLSETRAISLWNPDGKPLTDFEKNYLEFFRSLPDYHKHYKQLLLEKKLAYHGLACRLAAETPGNYPFFRDHDHIIFAGFNAIAPAQLSVIKYIVSSGKGEILWDADSYYVENQSQEAGRFLRKLFTDKSLGKAPDLSGFFAEAERNIHIAGVPGQVGQTLLAGTILKNIASDNNKQVLDKTAVVLADESLMLPMLNALPAEIEVFNVTMGYPLNQSPLFNLFDSIIEMHVNSRPEPGNRMVSFYHRQLLQILTHSHIQLVARSKDINEINQLIRAMKRPFIAFADIETASPGNTVLPLARLLMKAAVKPESLAVLLQQIAEHLRVPIAGKTEENKNEKQADTEVLYNISLIINRLHSLSTEEGLLESLRTFRSLFRDAAGSMPVAFYGEPLRGTQIMGMLETRTLDFENVILLSANEDKLPSGKSYNSFIPFDLRREFGLPTHTDQQAVYAYHFYRLLQRSKNIWLIYNSEANDLGGGEKSRFISQIIRELPAYSKVNKIQELHIRSSNQASRTTSPVIEKDEVVMERLIEMADKGFSPTTLSQLLICPMRFYFSTVLRLDETSEVEETIDFRTLGTVVHQVLQDFYTPFAGRFPGESDYRQMENSISTSVKAAMNKHYSGGDTETGRNLLIVRVAETWIKRYLEMEASAEYSTEKGDHFICAEQQLESFVTLKNDSSPTLKVRLKGTADRIDRVNGITRIIDYKTGKVDASDLKKTPAEVFSNEKESFPEKAFQLMFYQFLSKNHPDLFPQPEKVRAGIITFRKLAEGFLPLNSGDVLPLDMANEFGNHLTQLLEELFDKTMPFNCTPYEKRCANCNYKQICRREYASTEW